MTSAQDMLVMDRLQDPSSSEGIFELPCGYIDSTGVLHTQVQIREITGAEEDMLASDKTPGHQKMNELVTRCVVRIGSIIDRATLATVVKNLTIGDRVFLVYAVRRVTLGDLYPFTESCPKCEKEGQYEFNLSELEIKKMPDPMQRTFEAVLPKSNKAVRFKIATGLEEDAARRLAQDPKLAKDRMSQAMLLRMLELDGQPPTLQALKALGLRDRNYLKDIFQKVDGGVETEVDFTCPECSHDFKRELDITHRSFFFPSETSPN